MSGINPRDLISEIKKRPGIYDKSALTPPCREHKRQLWLEVADIFTAAEDWNSYSDIEKDARIDEIAAKWKHIKTNFHRDIKLEEAGQSHKKRKYVYFDDLEFMRPFVGVRLPAKRDASIDSLDEFMGNDTDVEMDTLLKCDDDNEEQEEEKYEKVDTNDSLSEERITRSSKRVIKPTQKALENKASSSTPVASRTQKEPVIKNFEIIKKTVGSGAKNASFKIRDGDVSFCLSLVPTLRKLNDGRKLRAKIDILKILHKYVEIVESRNLLERSHNNSDTSKIGNVEEDIITEDHLEECDDEIIIKNEDHDDPLQGKRGNNKTWWT